MKPQIKLGDLFTDQEIAAAFKLFNDDGRKVIDRVIEEIVMPAMPRIDLATGQENNPRYMAYVLQYAHTRWKSRQ